MSATPWSVATPCLFQTPRSSQASAPIGGRPKLVLAIGNRKVVMVYEPDSLVHANELSSEAKSGRLSVMQWAIQTLRSKCPNLWLYVDVGHPAWKSVDEAAGLLQQVKVEYANGFSINVSNVRPDTECISYGQAICAKLNMPNVRFIFDSGRNGGNPPDPSHWANPESRRFGRLPQFGGTNVDRCDGWGWYKRPGESDGANGDVGDPSYAWVGEKAPNAGELYKRYLYNDDVGDNVTTGVVKTSSGLLQRPITPGVSTQG